MQSSLGTILGSAVATVLSVTTLVITYLLDQYATLVRERRPDREQKKYRRPIYLLMGVLWLSVVSFGMVLYGVYFQSQRVLLVVAAMFSIGLFLLTIGLTWLARQQLSSEHA
jgi:L-asparagine transporter-like permease